MIYVDKKGHKIITSVGADSLQLWELPQRFEIVGDSSALQAIKKWFNDEGIEVLCCESNIEIIYIRKRTKEFKLVSNIADLA